MRVSEDRYNRDLRRIHLAHRFIRHRVRTHWICAFTGLSEDRVRKVYRSYDATLNGAARHRGPSAKRLVGFLRSPALRSEASAFGGLAHALGLIPPRPVPNARRALPSLELGERLCEAYELYRSLVPDSQFPLDQTIVLVVALAEATDLEVTHCHECHGALLVDRLGAKRRICAVCARASKGAGELNHNPPRDSAPIDRPQEEREPMEPLQQSLF